MADPVAGCFAKIERAREHLDALRTELHAFMTADPKPYGFMAHYDPERREYIVYDHPRPRRIPPNIGLIAGDAVHNIRSALDHLAVALASRPYGNGPGEFTAWPVIFKGKPKDYWGKRNSLLKGIKETYLTRIEGLQPYHAREIIERTNFRLGNLFISYNEVEEQRRLQVLIWLELIARLDILDKHRLVLPYQAVNDREVPALVHAKSYQIQFPHWRLAMEDGAELFRYVEIVPAFDGAEVHMDGEPSFNVVFGDPEWTHEEFWSERVKGAMSVADIESSRGAVADIVVSFLDAFRPAHDASPDGEADGDSASPPSGSPASPPTGSAEPPASE